jgi:hypothetical protein
MFQAIQSHPLAHDDDGGWTVRRREVIDNAAGVCARCGMTGADTATCGWHGEELVAAHTRCVVGLGAPTALTTGSWQLRAA